MTLLNGHRVLALAFAIPDAPRFAGGIDSGLESGDGNGNR